MAFSFATIAVRGVIARARKDATTPSPLFTVFVTAIVALAIILALVHRASLTVPMALAPLGAFAIGLHLFPPSPKRLRMVGWLLIWTSVVTTALLVATARLLRAPI